MLKNVSFTNRYENDPIVSNKFSKLFKLREKMISMPKNRPDCDGILRRKSWSSNLNDLRNNERFNQIVNKNKTVKIDCFHEDFIRRKFKFRSNKPWWRSFLNF
jgi:hypothetical protein